MSSSEELINLITQAHRKQTSTTDGEKRIDIIDGDLKKFIKLVDENELEEPMEEEAVNALTKAAYEICCVKKYYDVMNDKMIFFPSVAKTVMNFDLFEAAEPHFFDEEDEFPMEYSAGLRSVVAEAMGDDDDDDENGHDDEMIERLSVTVKLVDDLDDEDLQKAMEDAEKEDEGAENEDEEETVPEPELMEEPAATETKQNDDDDDDDDDDEEDEEEKQPSEEEPVESEKDEDDFVKVEQPEDTEQSAPPTTTATTTTITTNTAIHPLYSFPVCFVIAFVLSMGTDDVKFSLRLKFFFVVLSLVGLVISRGEGGKEGKSSSSSSSSSKEPVVKRV